jgi:hypothetical protein
VPGREFYGPRSLHHTFGGCILRTGIGRSGVTLLRAKKDGPCGEKELSILRPLMPHLRRAALLHGELTSLRSQLTAFTDHIDRYPHAFLLTDSDRSVLYLNAAGREITGRRDGLALEAGRLTIMSPTGDKELRTAVHAIVSNRKAPLRRIVVERPDGKALYRLLLMPLASAGIVPLGASRPAVAVLIIDAGSPPPSDPDVLRQMFSLTAAEARLAGKLALGWKIEEIAAESGISIENLARDMLLAPATFRALNVQDLFSLRRLRLWARGLLGHRGGTSNTLADASSDQRRFAYSVAC